MIRRSLLAAGIVTALLIAMINFVHAQESGPQGTEAAQANMGTAFTYQGRLASNGSPVNDSCDFNLYLYDAATGTGQIGALVSRPSIQVVNGYFTITNVDFGSEALTGAARWLRIDVRCPAGSGSYTTLAPRQALTPAPYALALPGLYTQQNATSPNVIGGYSGNTISPTVAGSVIGGGGNGMDPNRVQAGAATLSGGAGNLVRGYGATIGGGIYNDASGMGATIGGGGWNGVSARGNQALAKSSTIGGGYGNVISSTADYATLGGGSVNTASGLASTIGGGENNITSDAHATVGGGYRNEARAYKDTVGGGQNNIADGPYASVGGGEHNEASGGDATIGGGDSNTASGSNSTIAGGWSNDALDDNTAVGGGVNNVASGYASTVPGGYNNTAAGYASFAAGQYANAEHSGAFVWADASGTPFSSTLSNQFLVRAGGGMGINTSDTSANALTVNGRVIAGGTGVPIGSSESFVARGSNAGISLDDRSDADLRWVMYANGGSWRLWNGSDRLLINSSGVVTLTALGSAGSTTLCRNAVNQIATCSSSARYKNDIAALDLGLETVAELRPVTFDWNETDEHDLGFVAEEVDLVTPLLTTRNAQGQIEGVKYDRVTAVLVKAMQQQQQQISGLQQQNADLQARLASLDQNASAASFNVYNMLSVVAVVAVAMLIWQQRRVKRGQS